MGPFGDHLHPPPSTSITPWSNKKLRIDEYKALLDDLFSTQDTTTIKALLSHLLSDLMQPVSSRIVLQEFSIKLPTLPDHMHIELAKHALEKFQPQIIAFEEQHSKIRENLAATYERQLNWHDAARTLIGIPLESSQRILDADYKVEKYVKIAQLFLQDNECTEAERHLSKAAALISDCVDTSLVMRYKACLARIYELKQKFLEAALRYYELSRTWAEENKCVIALENAIICAVMAGAGPQRSRLLATLYRDERSSRLEVYPILQKMFTDRILRKEEVDTFVAFLKNRGTAITQINNDGSTSTLDKAIREHNLLSASKVYLNINFNELGVLLNLSPLEAEKVASKMISEDRLQGHIDQLLQSIHFHETNPSQIWDSCIEVTCSRVNKIMDMLAAKHPDFIENASKSQPPSIHINH